MIRSLRVIKTPETDPYQNIALEKYLTHHTREGECILFLWQNRRTVVIGRNQNAWLECDTEKLRSEGGFLARRLSGGGAVFHDLGNLNYTFCVRRPDYDTDRHLLVVLDAVRKLGIPAEKSGRNDMTADGRKFSGSAFYESGEYRYHHGTLMIDVDTSQLDRYLKPSALKLRSRGITSVRSRVVNLKEFCPGLTPDIMGVRLAEAFEEVYGQKAGELEADRLDHNEIRKEAAHFSSWEWNYGRRLPFTHQLAHRFCWGEIRLELYVNEGRIVSCSCSSDAMDGSRIEGVPDLLRGRCYDPEDILRVLETL